MSILTRIFGPRPAARQSPPPSRRPPVVAPEANSAVLATRKELLRVVLRDTLNRHGIPSAWIHAEVLVTASGNGEHGLHWRLLLKHWDERLIVHGVALQNSLVKRLISFEPLAANWLTGLSWQFMLEDESACPDMPEPRSWTSAPAKPIAPAIPETATPTADARADLEALMAARDEDFRRHARADAPAGGDATQPMWLGTEPAKL